MERTKISHINLNFPNICNMKCSYCFHNKAIRKIDCINNLEDKIIPILEKFLLNEDFVIVDFVGGEVMLLQEKLIKCIRKFKKYERNHQTKFLFKITTNGSYNEDLVKFLKNNIFEPNMVTISYDGINSDRSELNIEKLKILSEYKETINISISLSNKSIINFYNTVLLLSDLGFKNIQYYYLYESEIYNDINIINKFSEQLNLVINLCKSKNINLYNYNYAKEKYKEYLKNNVFEKGMNCESIKSVDILADGTFTPCANISNYMINTNEYTYDENSSIEDIEKGYSYLKDFYSIPHCDSDKCGNYQCVECSLYAVQYRDVHEQCKMRTVEREIFEKYMKLEGLI